jgi:hypothetical protein
MEHGPELVMIGLNVIFGLVVAWPLARRLERRGLGRGVRGTYLRLVGVYLAECISIAGLMMIPVGTVALSFVWGVLLGRALRGAPGRGVARPALLFGAFTSLPALSLIAIPLMMMRRGWDVLSIDEGHRFGVPTFLNLPGPLNTIMGFFAAYGLGLLVVKTLITVVAAFAFAGPPEPAGPADAAEV